MLQVHVQYPSIFNPLRPTDATDMAIYMYIWANIRPGHGFLPAGSKPLPKPMLTYHQWGLVTITCRQFCKRFPRHN